MRTPDAKTLAAIISEINFDAPLARDRERMTSHPFYQCMWDLLHMKEFRDILGAFALVSMDKEFVTEEDITIFGLSLFVTGLRVGRAESIPMPEEFTI